MSIKVVSIEDDGVASLASDGEMNGLAMSNDGGGLKDVLGEGWDQRQIALDLSEATFMDSAAIGWLLSLHKSLGEGGGRLILHSIHPNVQRVIDMMRIHKVLNLANDHDHAMQRLRGTH